MWRTGVRNKATRAFAAASALLCSCAGYVPGEKSSWDARIKQMCEQDGGVTVYERVHLTLEQFKRLGGIERALPLPSETDSPTGHPYFRRLVDTKLHEQDPEVVRSETQVVRHSDGKVLGRSIRYWRRGGDFPIGIAQESAFICPSRAELTSQIFMVIGAQ